MLFRSYSICIKYTYNQEDIEDNYLEALANFFKYMDSYDPVSYTHLDVYKRQEKSISAGTAGGCLPKRGTRRAATDCSGR